ncbi:MULTISPECIES: hypothetical protein [Prevotella]|nr:MULTISPECIES: hypothetical protein [Prevotella]
MKNNESVLAINKIMGVEGLCLGLIKAAFLNTKRKTFRDKRAAFRKQ